MSAVLKAEADSLDWVSVKSSNVSAAAYSPTFGRMFVRFKSGATYAYEKVPRAVFDAFLASSSKGRFVYYEIRAKGTDSVYAATGPF